MMDSENQRRRKASSYFTLYFHGLSQTLLYMQYLDTYKSEYFIYKIRAETIL